MKKVLCLILVIVIIALAGCSAINRQENTQPRFQSYKEIPGVTQADIDALEDLLANKPRLVYGMCTSTEAYVRSDGSVGGFTELLCNRLSELFGFEFELYTCGWNELNEKIVSKEIDFSSDFTATPERLKEFIMTDAIVQRTIKIFTDINSDSLNSIAQTRPIKCAFLSGSTTYTSVSKSWNLPFDPVFIDNQADVPELIKSGEIDAFIEEGTLEAGYDDSLYIKAEEYYPLTYSPVSLTTGNPELKPIIDIMQKYLKNGGYYELTELYNQGYKIYLNNKLSIQFTEQEKEYIQRHIDTGAAILAACESDNYPTSFYNEKDKEFQGMAIDTLDKISELTGLTFQVGNDPDVLWPELLEGLESGKYSVCTELLRSSQREGRFIWADKPYCPNNYALLSKSEYPNVDINQILFSRVGLMEGAGHTDVFLEWFPDSANTAAYYVGTNEAFAALERGEVDLIMANENTLLNLTNYQERLGFKANVIFNYSSDSFFGFNKDEVILCSIVNKALRYANTDEISTLWQRKVFDYQSKMFKDMIPYMITFVVIIFAALLVVLILFLKNKRISRNLEKTVAERTGELEHQASELALQTSMLETIFTSIPDLIFCKDLNYRFTRCNKSFEEYFGWREEDIIGREDSAGLGMTDEEVEHFRSVDKRVIHECRMIAVEEHIPAADGVPRLFETIKTPLMQNDEVIGIMGISRDITRRKAAEDSAENASKAKGDFLSRMSHEIRTPLNAIIGMNGIAMNTDDLAKIRDCLKKVDNASTHLLGIINDILDMSKIEADKFELSYNEFDFEKTLMNITNVINFRAEEKRQNLVVNIGESVPAFIFGDELRLSQVVTNLLSNAVKFTPENGTVVLNIDKTDDTDGEVTLQIDVTDDGIGISEEQQARLFTSFEQADGSISRKFGGTGLGLAISKRIVELMGGSIWIESELGKGSKFIFTIKAQKGKDIAHTQIPFEINRDNINILAVDDSEETRICISHIMGAHGLPCDVAASGVEALDKLKQCKDKPYNIFFIDWQMPGMDGIELTRKIKEITGDNSVVFMISVADWNTIEKEALSAGVKQFVPKPLFPSLLINAVNECLGVKSAKTELHTRDIGNNLNFTGHTILIAEDVEINQEIMSAVLEQTGVSIDFADNGRTAVSMFRENPDKYSLILMDIHMPEMDGLEATGTIRALELKQAKDIPIIAMTANVFKEDVEKCLAAGMNDHIGKPIDANDLFTKLGSHLK